MKSRPPTGERRDINIPIRMNETEHMLLAYAASIEGKNLSYFMMDCAIVQATKVMNQHGQTMEKILAMVHKANNANKEVK